MSREQYQPPTALSQSATSAFGSQNLVAEGAVTQYLCGDCGSKNVLRRAEPIRCKECGCRVLYKERTKRMVQFEAR